MIKFTYSIIFLWNFTLMYYESYKVEAQNDIFYKEGKLKEKQIPGLNIGFDKIVEIVGVNLPSEKEQGCSHTGNTGSQKEIGNQGKTNETYNKINEHEKNGSKVGIRTIDTINIFNIGNINIGSDTVNGDMGNEIENIKIEEVNFCKEDNVVYRAVKKVKGVKKTLKTIDEMECFILCEGVTDCKMASFHKRKKTCLLQVSGIKMKNKSFVSWPGSENCKAAPATIPAPMTESEPTAVSEPVTVSASATVSAPTAVPIPMTVSVPTTVLAPITIPALSNEVFNCSCSTFTPWSTCTKSCNGGERQRTRACTDKTGNECAMKKHETEGCNTDTCLPNCSCSIWTPWSTCTKSCNGGQRQRTRACNDNRGNQCAMKKHESEGCNTDKCVKNCSCSIWTSWSKCTKSCNGGERQRTQICNDNKGNECAMKKYEAEGCNTVKCAGYGQDQLSQYEKMEMAAHHHQHHRRSAEICEYDCKGWPRKQCEQRTSIASSTCIPPMTSTGITVSNYPMCAPLPQGCTIECYKHCEKYKKQSLTNGNPIPASATISETTTASASITANTQLNEAICEYDCKGWPRKQCEQRTSRVSSTCIPPMTPTGITINNYPMCAPLPQGCKIECYKHCENIKSNP